nr:helix-turn-helix transcriptional regulator [Maliibacterium massiliense]
MQFRNLRIAAKLTRKQSADALGTRKSAVSKWGNGAAMPRAQRVGALAQMPGWPADVLPERLHTPGGARAPKV